MDFFAIAMVPNDNWFVPLHRSRLRENGLNVEVTGRLFDKESNAIRPFLAEHPVFPNPGSYNEIVIGGGDEYVLLTEGPRKGLIVWTKYARPNEKPEPVSRFFWLDDRPEDDPAVQEAWEILAAAEDAHPQRRVEWPTIYVEYERHKFPTGIRDDGARKLHKIDAPEAVEDPEQGMSESQRQRAQKELAMVVGHGHPVTDRINRALWSTFRREEDGRLMVPSEYIQVHKNTEMFARVTDDLAVQRVVQQHELYTKPLHGKCGQIRFALA